MYQPSNCMGLLQALEYQMQQGLSGAARDSLYLMPKGLQHVYGPCYQANACTVELLSLN